MLDCEVFSIELYDADGNMNVSWYFNFYYRNPATGANQRFKPTFNINRISDKKTRYVYAKKVIKLVTQRMNAGEINPMLDPKLTLTPIPPLLVLLRAAHELAVKKMPYETAKSYSTHLKRFEEFMKEKGFEDLAPSKFTADHAQDFQFYLTEERELANPTVNNNTGRLHGYFEQLRKKRTIIVNPFSDLSSLPIRRSFKYIPFSEDEKVAIAEKLIRESPMLYLSTQLIYSCFARPKEITGLTRADLDLSGDSKYMILKYSNIKSKRTSYRQILPPLYNLILEMGIDRYPMKKLIFEEIIGRTDKDHQRRKNMTTLWYNLIQEDLGIDNNQYAMKHTGNCDYILSNPNYDILWLQQQNGHATLQQTQVYIRDLPIRRLQESNVNVRLFGSPHK